MNIVKSKPAMNWLGHCPNCGLRLRGNLKPISGSWFKISWKSKTILVCKQCDQLFDYDIARLRKANYLHAFFSIVLIIGFGAIVSLLPVPFIAMSLFVALVLGFQLFRYIHVRCISIHEETN